MATNQDSLNPHLDVSPAPLGPNRARPRVGQVPGVQPSSQFRGTPGRDDVPAVGPDPVDSADDAAPAVADPRTVFVKTAGGGGLPDLVNTSSQGRNGGDPEVKYRGPAGP